MVLTLTLYGWNQDLNGFNQDLNGFNPRTDNFETPKGKLSTISILKSGKSTSKVNVTISIHHGHAGSALGYQEVYKVSTTSNPITIKGTFSANNFDVQ